MTQPTNPAPRPPNHVVVSWSGEHRFEAGRPGGPAVPIDGDGKLAPSPVDILLSALAACSAVDVVDILQKRRTPPERLEVSVLGHRVETVPRRLRHVELEFRIDGAGVERAHAERAIDLAITKYCSVRDSLAVDIRIDWTLVLNEAPAAAASPAPPSARPPGM